LPLPSPIFNDTNGIQNLAPLGDAVPIVLAIDPPTGNDTSTNITAEQQDMEAILKNSTISV